MTTTTFQGIQRLFTYPFEDADWKQKLLIAYMTLVSSALFACAYRDGVASLSGKSSEADDVD